MQQKLLSLVGGNWEWETIQHPLEPVLFRCVPRWLILIGHSGSQAAPLLHGLMAASLETLVSILWVLVSSTQITSYSRGQKARRQGLSESCMFKVSFPFIRWSLFINIVLFRPHLCFSFSFLKKKLIIIIHLLFLLISGFYMFKKFVILLIRFRVKSNG